MDYKEGKFEELKDLYDRSTGWRDLGNYGWGFSKETVDLIRKITKEDGWRIFKVTNPNRSKTHGYKCDYYFISDKYKVFVTVAQEHWDNDSFQSYLDRTKKN